MRVDRGLLVSSDEFLQDERGFMLGSVRWAQTEERLHLILHLRTAHRCLAVLANEVDPMTHEETLHWQEVSAAQRKAARAQGGKRNQALLPAPKGYAEGLDKGQYAPPKMNRN